MATAAAVATMGGSIEVPTLDGRANLQIKPGTQSGTVMRMKGKGIKILRDSSGRRGDQYVKIVVEVPTNLNSEQKEKLKEFAESCGDKVHPMKESFFEKAKRWFGA